MVDTKLMIGLAMVGIPLILGALRVGSLGDTLDSLMIWSAILGVIIVIWRFKFRGKN